MEESPVTNVNGSKGRIFSLSNSEVRELCKPGEGANTCIWLVMGKGWECLYFNRRAPNLLGEILEDRWKAGKTVAKRDGCEEIRKYE